jgi:hypothetical protein
VVLGRELLDNGRDRARPHRFEGCSPCAKRARPRRNPTPPTGAPLREGIDSADGSRRSEPRARARAGARDPLDGPVDSGSRPPATPR